ncbi:CS1 type fimbrial major subunit [Pandoraea anhela]|uniref:CFA/I fimbrial subunit B n=1 Tax=Pandoraea anhela TaxID=2508295 RepID=A0A5E4U656_9BURK|nr:CS1 type fimbrial major subunit [Pandoraea anhela]VVD95556.1 CFA/I fimbrial subunit B [Pandoraea anhela]
MKTFKHLAAVAALALPMTAAYSAEVVMDLSANIDPTLSVLQANGNPMPSSLDFAYHAASRDIVAPTIQTRLYTNDPTQNVNVRLGSASTLVHTTSSEVAAIPLTVRFDGQVITTANTAMNAAQIWTGAATGESKTIPLSVTGRVPGTNPPIAGRYVGRLEMLIVASAN